MKKAHIGDWVWVPTHELAPFGFRRMYHEERGVVIKFGKTKDGSICALVRYRNADAMPDKQEIREKWWKLESIRRCYTTIKDFWVMWEQQNGVEWNGGQGDQTPEVLHFLIDNGFTLEDLQKHLYPEHRKAIIAEHPEYFQIDGSSLGLNNSNKEAARV